MQRHKVLKYLFRFSLYKCCLCYTDQTVSDVQREKKKLFFLENRMKLNNRKIWRFLSLKQVVKIVTTCNLILVLCSLFIICQRQKENYCLVFHDTRAIYTQLGAVWFSFLTCRTTQQTKARNWSQCYSTSQVLSRYLLKEIRRRFSSYNNS